MRDRQAEQRARGVGANVRVRDEETLLGRVAEHHVAEGARDEVEDAPRDIRVFERRVLALRLFARDDRRFDARALGPAAHQERTSAAADLEGDPHQGAHQVVEHELLGEGL